MHDTAANNKRIVKNTAMLYARMFLVLGISLYTSRVILDALGVIDFGIYNVVAGVTGMLLFFTSSLSNASQRFISFEIGRKDYDSANKVFNLSFELYGLINILLFIALESVGFWLVNDKLIIPAERKTKKKIEEALKYFEEHIEEFMKEHFGQYEVDLENYEVR